MNCTRCVGLGFINLHQIPDEEERLMQPALDWHAVILNWIADHPGTDVQVCDCCGDGEHWYGQPGEHNYAPGGNEPFPECF